MIKKEMIAMLLAGGQGSRLGVLTSKVAKPAVAFGGKYRIIDFPLSIGIPWDLDRNIGGVTVLPPYEKMDSTEWYTGTANAIMQNIDYMDSYNPDYILILSGDHIYKMDYEVMLDFHKQNKADVTIAVMPVPWEEASRFGIMVTDEQRRIVDFQEKPATPESNLASMGIYIFNWKTLKEALLANADRPNLDFGMHIIPYCREKEYPLYAYEFNGYWKDVGTLYSYWQANMELVDIVPDFNLYEEYWKIYTNSKAMPPQYLSSDSEIEKSIISGGSEIYGKIYNSVIGSRVTIGRNTVVRDSIIMDDTVIGADCELEKVIIAENVKVGDQVRMGVGEETENETCPNIYNHGLCTIGEKSVIPDGVTIGKNVCISGLTSPEDYPDEKLLSGKTMIKAGD